MARQLKWNYLRRVLFHCTELGTQSIPSTKVAEPRTLGIAAAIRRFPSLRCLTTHYRDSTLAQRTSHQITNHAIGAKPNPDDCKKQAARLYELLKPDGLDVAEYWIRIHPGFTILEPEDIALNYKTCKNAGFSDRTLFADPGILSYPPDIVETKINLLKDVGLKDINHTAPMFHLTLPKLRSLAMKLKFERVKDFPGNRIHYLAECLECSPVEISKIIAKYYFMQTISTEKLKKILEILLDAKVSKEVILNDVWTFRYNADVIRDRLKRMTDAQVTPIKTWMIRCPEISLARRIEKEMIRRQVLGDNATVVDYLSERLNCSKEEVVTVISKKPYVMNVNLPKLEQVVDFLLENGYTTAQILRVPRLLIHSLETTKERHTELAQYGHRPNSLLMLCKSKRLYDKYLVRVKERYEREQVKKKEAEEIARQNGL